MRHHLFPGLLLLAMLIMGCEDLYVKPSSSNQHMEDFDAAWNRIDEVYPFLDFKKIDWDSVYTVYSARVEAARGDEFYEVLNDFLAALKDGHVYYRMPGGGEIYPYYPERSKKAKNAYSPFVVRQYFDKKLKVTASESAEYEILPGNIGYVFLSSFQENYLQNEFPAVLEYLRNTNGLIIDIRQKKGGSLNNVEAVITRFLTGPLPKPRYHLLGEVIDLPPFEPRGPFVYTKPVVVLINGSTFSAGEWTTEILKQLPNVTAVGDTTGGGGVLSQSSPPETVGEYPLPSGIVIYIGTGYMERYDGETVEWNGVPPDIRVPQTADDIKAKRDKQLEYAIEMLK